MTATSGIIAALSAPLFEAVGFLEFERHWRDGRGSAFSLNLFKCNVSSLGFLFMVWLERMGVGSQPGPSPLNAMYLEHEPPNVYGEIKPPRGPFLRGLQDNNHMDPAIATQQQFFSPVLQTQQTHPEQQNAQPSFYPQESQPVSPQFFQQPEQLVPIQNHEFPQNVPVQGEGQQVVSQNEQPQYFHDQTQPLHQTFFDPPHGYNLQKPGMLEDSTSFTPWFQSSMQRNDGVFTVVTVSNIMLSSLLGIFIGDCCELEALRLIGARRVLLMASMKPFAASFFAHWFLQEDLHAAAWFGMALTMIGVLLVVQQSMENISKSKKHNEEGIKNAAHRSTTTRKRRGALKRMNDSFTSDRSDDSDINGAAFCTIWETNGFSYISSAPAVRHKSLSKFDALYDSSSDEENSESLLDEELFDFDDDFDDDGEFYSGNNGQLVELIHINPLSSDRMRSVSATSIGSWGSIKQFVEIEDSEQEEDEKHQWHIGSDETCNIATEDCKNSGGEEDTSDYCPSDIVQTITTAAGITHTSLDKSLFLLPEEIAQEDIAHIGGGENFEDGDKVSTKGRRRRLLSNSSSTGSLKSLKSECGPPPGSKRENTQDRLKRIRQGYLLALCNVCLDSYGFLLTKQYGTDMSTWEINFIRYGFAGFILLLVSFFLRARDIFCGNSSRNKSSFGTNKSKRKIITRSGSSSHVQGTSASNPMEAPDSSWYRLPNLSTNSWLVMLVGVLFVSFLCPALQSYALFRLAFSLAMTLNSVTPLYALPLLWLLKNQKPSKRGCWGAIIAVTGVAVLCIWGYDWV